MKPFAAILFAAKDSIYKTIPGLDIYDEQRNALNFKGKLPVIAHPPCRLWSIMKGFCTAHPSERLLAAFALLKVQQNGGILEHPHSSSLWPFFGLPGIGEKPDKYGGWTMAVPQFWFGHRAEKPTRLYIVGVRPAEIPVFNLKLGEPEFICSGSRKGTPEIKKSERSATPKAFADFLVQIVKTVPCPRKTRVKTDGGKPAVTKKTKKTIHPKQP